MSCLLGIDYGTRRVGVAVSDDTATLATAVGTHREGVDGSLFEWLRALIDERRVVGFVVGLPLTADGREADMAARVRRFARRLEEEFSLPVVLVDERFSSHEATGYLRQGGRRRRRREEIDATAAEIILQRHLDSGETEGGPEA